MGVKTRGLFKPSQIIAKNRILDRNCSMRVVVNLHFYHIFPGYYKKVISFYESFLDTITFKNSYIEKFQKKSVGGNFTIILIGNKKHLSHIKPTLENWFSSLMVSVETEWMRK